MYLKEEVLNTMTIKEVDSILENADLYDYKELSVSLVYCFYCHNELRKEENYTRLLHQLGNTKEEQRQKFKQFHKYHRIVWITSEQKLPDDICLNCGTKTETRASSEAFSFCSEQCREEDSKQPIFAQHTEDFECDTNSTGEYLYRLNDQLYRESKTQGGKEKFFKLAQKHKALWNSEKKSGECIRDV